MRILKAAIVTGLAAAGLAALTPAAAPAPAAGEELELAPVVIRETAPREAGGAVLDGPVTELRFDPRVDLQTRNSAAAAADSSIRGGIFTQSGFRAGAATPETIAAFSILIGVKRFLSL